MASRMEASGIASPIADPIEDPILQGRVNKWQVFCDLDRVGLDSTMSGTVNNGRCGRANRLLANDGFEDKQSLVI